MVTSYAVEHNLPFDMLRIFAECFCQERLIEAPDFNKKATLNKKKAPEDKKDAFSCLNKQAAGFLCKWIVF